MNSESRRSYKSYKLLLLQRALRRKLTNLKDRLFRDVFQRLFRGISQSTFLKANEIQESSRKAKKEVNKESIKERRSENFPAMTFKLSNISREQLLNFSILFSLIGILSLFILSALISPKFVLVSNINNLPDGAYIKTVGFFYEIDSKKFKLCDAVLNSGASKEIQNAECVTVLLSQGTLPLSLLSDDQVKVTGFVKSFNNRKYLSLRSSKDIEILTKSR